MRTKTEIISEINQTQELYNRLIMDIGQGYARAHITKDNSLIAAINLKIDTFKETEAHLQMLEQELAKATE